MPVSARDAATRSMHGVLHRLWAELARHQAHPLHHSHREPVWACQQVHAWANLGPSQGLEGPIGMTRIALGFPCFW